MGRGLHDHPAVCLPFGGTPAAIEAVGAFREQGGQMYVLPVIAKLRSARCAGPFDLHLFPMAWPAESGGWEFVLAAANVAPRARGSVRLASRDPRAAPVIDTRFLDDADGEDAAVLWDGVELARGWARQPGMAEWCGGELPSTAALAGPADLRGASAHYFHPVGTCRMGPDPAAGAAAEARGRVHGWDNLYVADAALMPAVPRANTNLPTLVVAERVAGWLSG